MNFSRFSILLSLSLLACQDPERLDGHYGDQIIEVEQSDAGMLVLEAGETVDDINDIDGTWALFMQNRLCMSSVGTITESIIWSWYLLDLTARKGSAAGEVAFDANVRVCHEKLSPLVLNMTTWVPDIIPAAQPERVVPGFFLSTEKDGDFVLSEITERWGVPNIGLEEEMPQDLDDSRVTDQDGDGYPGVTFGVNNALGNEVCQVRVVQRKRLRYRGQVVNSARIEGHLWTEIDKVVLDATQSLCGSKADFTPSPHESSFVMVRLDGREGGYNFDFDEDGVVACTELNDNLDAFMSTHQLVFASPDNESCRAAAE